MMDEYCLKRVCEYLSQFRHPYKQDNDLPHPLTPQLVERMIAKIDKCGYNYIDVISGEYIERTIANNHPLYWKWPFCGPLVHKSLVVWCYYNLYKPFQK